MVIIQLEAQLSADQLLQAVVQLPPPEFEQFVSRVNDLRPRSHKTRRLSRRESQLLLQINQAWPAATQDLYDQLTAKRRDETLTAEEYQELLRLTDEAEALDGKRLESLIELARMRGTSVTALMLELEMQPLGL